MSVIIVAGIDTGIGKSYVTGLIAAYLKQTGCKATTLKLVQTGSELPAEDIVLHRQLMSEPLSEFDLNGLTCPYVFSFPASPHLAAAKSNQTIDPDKILNNIAELQKHYDTIIVEAAGGLYVPLHDRFTIMDLIKQEKWPCILASSSRLGSINHTWLSLESLLSHHIRVIGITYTPDPNTDQLIYRDTLQVIKRQWPGIPVIPIPWITADKKIDLPDFSMLPFNPTN